MPGRRHKDFHFVDVHVGARLRRRREQMGMSRERLAAAVGDITFQQIHKYEIAENRLSASRLHFFARLLKVSIAYCRSISAVGRTR
jgi:transcriptional regulator with XRE-family HTH domain